MSDGFCNPCGKIHGGPRCIPDVKREDAAGNNIRITRKFSAVKMATAGDSSDDRVVEEITKDVRDLCIDEGERRVREEIRQLERDKRMFELVKRRDVLEKERAARDTAKPSPSEAGGAPAATQDAGHSTYGEVSRRSRTRHRRSRSHSNSSSRSRTRSTSRRRKSKWTLKNHTEDKKEVRKLSIAELQEASCLWFLSLDGVTLKDAQSLFSHLAYMASKAKHELFKDTAHTRYDTAIRKMAEKEGFAAFTAGNAAASLIHYGHEAIRAKTKSSVTTAAKGLKTFERGGKRACFPWNKEVGCDRREDDCDFGHWCSKCGSRSHKRTKCTRD